MTRWMRPWGLAACAAALFLLPAATAGAQKGTAPKVPATVEAILDATLDHVWQLTDLHWHKGEYNHILNLYKVVVAGWPDQVEAYANGGWLLWSMNRDAEAIALYEQGIKANPKSAYMFDELGQHYNRKKDWPKAIRYLEQAAARPDVQPLTLHTLAHCYERTGRLKESLKTWERAAADPHNAARLAARNHAARIKRLLAERSQ